MIAAPRRVAALVAASAMLLALVSVPAAAAAAAPIQRTSFIRAQQDFMCVVCHEPLAVANSPEAFQERGVIRGLVLAGDTRQQIDREMVLQYGPAVLASPPAHGVNLLVYIVPPLVLVLGLITVAVTLPRWRRRTRDRAATETASDPAASGPTPKLSPDDARRLDDDLARSL